MKDVKICNGFPLSMFAPPPIFYPIPLIKLLGIPSEIPEYKTNIPFPFVIIT